MEDREKVARLCYNDNYYKSPTGFKGKSKGGFEGIFHFGMEEWLFNEKYRYKNYIYGYIEIGKVGREKNRKYENKKYDLFLYNTDSSYEDESLKEKKSKRATLIAKIKDAEFISFQEDNKVRNYFKEKGLDKEREKQIINTIGIESYEEYKRKYIFFFDNPLMIFNLKYEEKNLKKFDKELINFPILYEELMYQKSFDELEKRNLSEKLLKKIKNM